MELQLELPIGGMIFHRILDGILYNNTQAKGALTLAHILEAQKTMMSYELQLLPRQERDNTAIK